MTTESGLRLSLLPSYSTLNQIETLSALYEAKLMDALKADESAQRAFFEVSQSEQKCFRSVPVLQRLRDGVIQSGNSVSENAPHFDNTQIQSLLKEIVFTQNVKNLRSRVLNMTSNLGKHLDENSQIGGDISTCLKKVVSGIASYVKDQRGLSPDEREDIDKFLLQSTGVREQLAISECFSEALQIVEALGDSNDPIDHDLLIKLLFGNDLPIDKSPISTHFSAVTGWLERLTNSEKLRDHELLSKIISKQDSNGDTVLHKHSMFDRRIVIWLTKLAHMAQDESRELLYKTLLTKNALGESFFHTRFLGFRLQTFIPIFEMIMSAEDLSADVVDAICHDEKLLSGNENELRVILPLLQKMIASKFERHRTFLEKVMCQQVDDKELVFSPDHFKIVLPVILQLAESQDPTQRDLFFDVVSRSLPTTSPLIHQNLRSFYPFMKKLKDGDFLSRLYEISDSKGQTLKGKMVDSRLYKI